MSTNGSPTRKVILWTAGILAAVIIASYIIVIYLINNKLPELLGEKIQMTDARVDLFGGDLTIKEPSFAADTAQTSDSSIQFQIRAHRLKIHDVSYRDILFNNTIDLAKITLQEPVIDLILPKEEARTKENRQELGAFIGDFIKQIQLEKLSIEGAMVNVHIEHLSDTTSRLFNVDLQLKDIVMDSSTSTGALPFRFQAGAIQLDSCHFSGRNNYVVHTGQIQKQGDSYQINGLGLTPTISKESWGAAHPFENTRNEFHTNRMTLEGLQWDFALQKASLGAKKIVIDNMRGHFYKDKRAELPPPKIIPLLTEMILNLPVTININELSIAGGSLTYEQRSLNADQTGEVVFDPFYLSAYNITNDSASIQQDPTTIIDIQSQFMKVADLQSQITLNMAAPDQSFHAMGTLGKIDLSKVNNMLAPASGMRVSGTADKLDFDFSGNDLQAKGKVLFLYDEFEIDLYDQEEKENSWLKSTIGNLIARDDNEDKDKGQVYFVRYQNKSFFNYLWNCICTGLLDTVLRIYTHPDEKDPPKHPKFDYTE